MILCKTFEKNCFPTKHCYVNTFQSGRNSLVIKFLAPTKQLLKCQHDIPFILHELRMKMKVELKHVAEKLS